MVRALPPLLPPLLTSSAPPVPLLVALLLALLLPLLALFVVAWLAGVGARRVGLPHITGALFAGVIFGPVLHVVTAAHVRSLAVLAAVTLAWIAVLAGARMSPPMLRETWRSALTSALCQLVVCVPLLGVVFFVAAPFEAHGHGAAATAVTPATAAATSAVSGPAGLAGLAALAGLWGIVATTRSPIITVAILQETKADGPLARHILSVVVLQSALSLPLFFVVLSVARAAFTWLDVVKIVTSLGFVALGFALAHGIRGVLGGVLGGVHGGVLGGVLGGATGSPVLALGERAAPLLLTVFFAMAGASVDVDALVALWHLAVAACVVRAILTFAACRIAHALSGDVDVVRRLAWLGLLPQAGVTVALASLEASSIPVHGPAFATLAIAVVTVDEVVGAPLLRHVLARAGETRPSSPRGPSEEIRRSAAPNETVGR